MLTLEIAKISNAKHWLKLKFKGPIKDHSNKNMLTSDGKSLLMDPPSLRAQAWCRQCCPTYSTGRTRESIWIILKWTNDKTENTHSR